MKKYKSYIGLLLLSAALALSSCFLFFCSSSSMVLADDNRTYIGRCFKYTHVSTTTKVYLRLGDPEYNMVASSGRTIYSEIVRDFSFNDPNGYSIDDSNLIDYFGAEDWYNRANPGMILYYYYVSPSEPLLTSFHNMYNDVASLIYALQILQAEAIYQGISDVNNAVLSYVRCINTKYDDWKWEIVSGERNDDLIQTMNYLTVGGIEVNEFFASFMSCGEYNSAIYRNCGSAFLTMNLPLLDYYENEIDLIHLFASLDGVFEGTGEMTGSLMFSPYISQTTFRFLASWAGDLQSAAVIIGEEYLTGYSFDDILGDGTYHFDYRDFYADIDAVLIAGGINLINVTSISSAINTFYNSTLIQPTYTRFGYFMLKVAEMSNPDYVSFAEEFHKIVYDFLALDANGNDLNPSYLLPHDAIKYKILGCEYGSTIPSTSVRMELAEEFFWYLY